MPATVTHAFFSEDVYDILPIEVKENVNLGRFRMFSQSFDSLIFYNILNFKDGKPIRKFQSETHKYKTQEFFLNLINYIKDNNLYSDSEVKSFLYGFICHFVLDSTVHPYVIYRTGLFNKNNKETYKYNNLHSFMEVFLDNDMIRRRLKINPYTFKFSKYCFDLDKFSDTLNSTINYTFFNTYRMYNGANIYYNSLKHMNLFLKLFRSDRFGFKRDIYKLIDTFTSNKRFRFEALSYYYPLKDRHDFLNNQKVLWHNPADYKITSNDSYIDLYLKAIKTAKEKIIKVDNYMNGKRIELKKVFPTADYYTGLDYATFEDIKYFEF